MACIYPKRGSVRLRGSWQYLWTPARNHDGIPLCLRRCVHLEQVLLGASQLPEEFQSRAHLNLTDTYEVVGDIVA